MPPPTEEQLRLARELEDAERRHLDELRRLRELEEEAERMRLLRE